MQHALGHLAGQREAEQEFAAVVAPTLRQIRRPMVGNELVDRRGSLEIVDVHIDGAHAARLNADAVIRLARPSADVVLVGLVLGPLGDTGGLALAVVARWRLADALHLGVGRYLGAWVRHHRQQIGGQAQH